MDALWTWILALTFYQQLTAITVLAGLCVAVAVIVVLLIIKLLGAISTFLAKSDIKKIGAGGVEFYNDNAPKKPTRRRVTRSKP
jgi:hypothetical protein